MVSKVEKQERGVVSKAGKNRKWIGSSLQKASEEELRDEGVGEIWKERAKTYKRPAGDQQRCAAVFGKTWLGKA